MSDDLCLLFAVGPRTKTSTPASSTSECPLAARPASSTPTRPSRDGKPDKAFNFCCCSTYVVANYALIILSLGKERGIRGDLLLPMGQWMKGI
ncbi:hypothetical protein EJB05_04593, partial [Eragrostis curvula]